MCIQHVWSVWLHVVTNGNNTKLTLSGGKREQLFTLLTVTGNVA